MQTITFRVMAGSDAHIGLSSENGDVKDMYEIGKIFYIGSMRIWFTTYLSLKDHAICGFIAVKME